MAKRRRHWFGPYHFLVTFPDRVYPFSTVTNGKRVRWTRSYELTLSNMQRRLGSGRYGIRLATYRMMFHIVGAGLFIIAGTLISQALWGSDAALPILLLLGMVVITYQEFVLQPRTYKQRLGKGIVDWISWAAPLSMYVFYLLH